MDLRLYLELKRNIRKIDFMLQSFIPYDEEGFITVNTVYISEVCTQGS